MIVSCAPSRSGRISDSQQGVLRACCSQIEADRYHVLRLLGSGTYGEVYLARDQGSAASDSCSLVALKVIRVRSVRDSIDAWREVAFLRATKDLGPFFVQFHRLLLPRYHAEPRSRLGGEVRCHPRALTLCMDACMGGTVAERLATNELGGVDDAIELGVQLFKALVLLHEGLGVAHRDIATKNLLVDAQGGLRVADLGSACVLPAADSQGRTAPVFGRTYYVTRWYRAPELWGHHARRATYSPDKADVWAAACVLCEVALCGRVLFCCDTQDAFAALFVAALGAPADGLPRELADRSVMCSALARALERSSRSAVPTHTSAIRRFRLLPPAFKGLLLRLLDLDPTTRPSASEGLDLLLAMRDGIHAPFGKAGLQDVLAEAAGATRWRLLRMLAHAEGATFEHPPATDARPPPQGAAETARARAHPRFRKKANSV